MSRGAVRKTDPGAGRSLVLARTKYDRTWRDRIAEMPAEDALEYLIGLMDDMTWRPGMSRTPLPCLPLSPAESKILFVLDKAGGRTVSHRTLVAAARDHAADGTMMTHGSLKASIHKLRQKLIPSGLQIVAQSRVGYWLKNETGKTLQW